jgi:hypothetical protein
LIEDEIKEREAEEEESFILMNNNGSTRNLIQDS